MQEFRRGRYDREYATLAWLLELAGGEGVVDEAGIEQVVDEVEDTVGAAAVAFLKEVRDFLRDLDGDEGAETTVETVVQVGMLGYQARLSWTVTVRDAVVDAEVLRLWVGCVTGTALCGVVARALAEEVTAVAGESHDRMVAALDERDAAAELAGTGQYL